MRTRTTTRRLSLAAVASLAAVFGLPGVASAEPVPAPDATERADTVPILARAAESQGICYGWRLETDYVDPAISVGSNLGDGIAVDSDPQRCPRWIEVTAVVTYTPDSSESEDYATISVHSLAGLDSYGMENDLGRFGLDSTAFVDEPGWAICRAATVLPLLAAERGLADPLPVATGQPAASIAPLANAGSDMWRDRHGYLIGGSLLLLVTAMLVALGMHQRHQQYNREAERQRRLAARNRRTEAQRRLAVGNRQRPKAGPDGGRTREGG